MESEQTDRISDMEQHLLYHKALAEDEGVFERIGRYLEILQSADSGEKLQDPMDESVRAVFSLVLDKGLDPWAIDLEEFARMYSEKVSENRFDMIVAGRLLLMAWRILNLQSEATMEAADPIVEPEIFEEDFDFVDEDPMVVPDIPLVETYARKDMRPVTMMDLLDAFEEAKRDAEIQKARESARAKMSKKKPSKFENKAHEEDDKKAVEAVYSRILTAGRGPMPLLRFYTASREDNITVFVSILHLVRVGVLDVSQETLPYGEILISAKPAVPVVAQRWKIRLPSRQSCSPRRRP